MLNHDSLAELTHWTNTPLAVEARTLAVLCDPFGDPSFRAMLVKPVAVAPTTCASEVPDISQRRVRVGRLLKPNARAEPPSAQAETPRPAANDVIPHRVRIGRVMLPPSR